MDEGRTERQTDGADGSDLFVHCVCADVATIYDQ